jgi:hypothetical protein
MLLVKRCSLDHRSEAMAGTATRWVKVIRGNAVEYETQPLQNVGALLKMVKAMVPRKLENVDVDDLTLYEYEGGKASSGGCGSLCGVVVVIGWL